MKPVVYDGSFTGLLTAIFEVYEYKITNACISKDIAVSGSLFGEIHTVQTNAEKAARVWNKLEDKLSRNAMRQLYKTFLFEMPNVENTILRYIEYVIREKKSIENDYSNTDVLLLQQASRKVDREKHRMEAFVRFQLTKDGLYYAVVQPDYNVLPLIIKHFKDRYADQRWLIYDTRRKYGIYYDLEQVVEVEIDFSAEIKNESEPVTIYDEKEELYQTLWQQYFLSINITARKNFKLHIKHMPRRYWKNLIEKKNKLP